MYHVFSVPQIIPKGKAFVVGQHIKISKNSRSIWNGRYVFQNGDAIKRRGLAW